MKKLYLSFIIIVLSVACNPNNEGKLPPPAEVLMVEKFTDKGAIERGIDADPDYDGIYIEWYLLNDPNISSYNIYRKLKNESIFSKLTTITVEGDISPFDTVLSYIDQHNLVLDDNEYVYYYYITATNKDGVEGPEPDSLTQQRYRLLPKTITEITPDIKSNEQPIFIWNFPENYIPNYYIIRIENAITDTLVFVRRFLNDHYTVHDEKDLSTIFNPPVFHVGSYYRWRIDIVGQDSLYSGSESRWKHFNVIL
jgi:hypothetical protein